MRGAVRVTEALAVRVEGIPEELKSYPSWVVWRLEVRHGEPKPTKVPYDPLTGRRASTTDSRTWRSFEEAVAALEVGDYDGGLGFVFSSGDPFTGIDLDGVRNPETGELTEGVHLVVERLGGYAEISPSGTGIHVVVRGRLPEGVRHKVEREDGIVIEAYCERRFFTVTGRRI